MAKDRDQDTAASAAAASAASAASDQRQQENAETYQSQSRRPALHHHHRSDDSHNSDNTHHHGQPHFRAKGKHHVVGRTHGRVPSSKGLHKHQGPQRPPHKRGTSSPDIGQQNQRQDKQHASAAGSSTHRRSTSEVKLPRHASSGSLAKTASQSSLKRNRSHAEITKRSKSSDKLKRTSSGTGINRGPVHKPIKSQVHFDLGDDPEDEWVDASGSNSPYLSRKGSIVSSGPSSRAGESAANSRPHTPSEAGQMSSLERERLNHKEYLTSRLLQRTPSHGAPPQMTPNLARGASSAQLTPGSSGNEQESRSLRTGASTLVGSSGEGVTSRFMGTGAETPGLTPQGSFFHPEQAISQRRDEKLRGSRSAVDLSRAEDDMDQETPTLEATDSALMPRAARRASRAPPAETSRIQQKLNLQRASSVIEPGQSPNPLIGPSGGRGYDSSGSRDPRMSKLLERTGMEYLVVRRYQNPIARSLNRLSRQQGVQIQNPKNQTRQNGSTATNGNKSLHPSKHHMRNVSMPESRRPMTPTSSRRPGTATNRGLASGQQTTREESQDEGHRMSGATIDGAGDTDDGIATLLRNMWEKSMDFSTSAD